MFIHRLTYMSRPTWLARVCFGSTIDSIVASSRRNNVRDDLSGALLGNESWFVQVLEGPPAALSNTMNRIFADNRHEDVHVFETRKAPKRLFASWTMFYSSLDDVEPAMVWACVDHFQARSSAGATAAIELLTSEVRKAAA